MNNSPLRYGEGEWLTDLAAVVSHEGVGLTDLAAVVSHEGVAFLTQPELDLCSPFVLQDSCTGATCCVRVLWI